MSNVKHIKEPSGLFRNILSTGATASVGIRQLVVTGVNEIYAGKAKNTVTNIKEVTAEILAADDEYIELLESNDAVLASTDLSPRRRRGRERREQFLEAAQNCTLEVQLKVM